MGGVLPRSTYGTELVEAPVSELKALRNQWVSAAGHKPIGTPRNLQIMALGVARDPGFIVAMRPLVRWTRGMATHGREGVWWHFRHDHAKRNMASVGGFTKSGG